MLAHSGRKVAHGSCTYSVQKRRGVHLHIPQPVCDFWGSIRLGQSTSMQLCLCQMCCMLHLLCSGQSQTCCAFWKPSLTCKKHAGHPSQTLLSWVTMLWKAPLQHASLGPGKSADSIPRQPSDSSDYKAKSLKGTQTWAGLRAAKGISTEPCQETIFSMQAWGRTSASRMQTNLGLTVFPQLQMLTESQLRSWPWSSV